VRAFLLLACLLLLSISADRAAPAPPTGPLAARWKRIDALLAKDQTATAAPLVEAIYQQARQENNGPAYVRALLYKIRLLRAKQEDADEKAIALLEQDVRTASFPARPILHSLLAQLYTSYLNQNRGRLYQRTPGAAPTADTAATADGGTPLATWDLGRLGARIVRHYYQSVDDEPQRQLSLPLARLGDLAAGGDAEGRALRPTLYDLLAHRAIEGLQNQELYVTRPEQRFEATDPQLFGSAAEFAALRLRGPAADSLNGQLHALRLLQCLTAARLERAPHNLAALADVDLLRLDYLHGFTQNTALAPYYDSALVRLAEAYRALPVGTEFLARRVELLRATDPVAAVRLARETEARFPKSRGAARARLAREQLERPALELLAADIVVPGQPWRLAVTARNVAALHAWAYRITLADWEKFGEYDRRNRAYPQTYARALKAAPAAAWDLPVPARPVDYEEHRVLAAGPALPIGYYLLVVSTQRQRPDQPGPGQATSYAAVGASELSTLYRPATAQDVTPLLLLHRQTGAPLAGVKAQGTYRRYNRKLNQDAVAQESAVLESSAGGEIQMTPPTADAELNTTLLRLRLWRGADTLLLRNLGGYGYGYRREADGPPKPDNRCFLFTDRAIYRPGQTVYFKGILLEQTGRKTRLLAQEKQEVELDDANGQTVQTLKFVTNDFGSFNGSFVLPTGLLNGEFTLMADDGELRFAVEDYKRPTFFVQLDSVPGRPQLGQSLTMGGRARAYAGPATDGAAVRYRVTRRLLWALFDGEYNGEFGRGLGPGYGGQGEEIAHGTTTTDAQGRFSLRFTPPLVPADPSRRGWAPGYAFEVTADVTDAAGETRTGARGLAIGRNPLTLRLTGPEEADKRHLPAFTLLATNATGEPLAAAGTLRLLARRFGPNPAGVPGSVLETEAKELPGAPVATLPFDTKTGPLLALSAALAALPTGYYRLEARAAGADTARARLNFTLYDSEAATVPVATPDWFVTLADTVAPGQPASILLGSSEADAHILLEVERGGQLLRKEWLTLGAGEQRRVRIESGPAAAEELLFVHTTQVRDNVIYRHSAMVQVAEKPQPLRLSINTFRDRLQPGQRETWRIAIHQASGRAAAAELLATLYDQSLDVFRPHSWAAPAFEAGGSPVFGWQGDFGSANWIAVAAGAPAGGFGPVEYPFLYTWGAFGPDPILYGNRPLNGRGSRVQIRGLSTAAAPMMAEATDGRQLSEVVVAAGYVNNQLAGKVAGVQIAAGRPVDLSAVAARTDFRETAFWQPALRTDKQGNIELEFQMPEAVTRWQLLALAHDKDLHFGQLSRQLVTQKEIQITPNAPRFLRQGDTFTFPAKLSNLTDHATSGTAQLTLLDAATGQDITSQLLKGPAQQAVAAGAHQSAALGWELHVPDDFAPVAVTYRVVAQGQSAVSSEQSTGKKPKKPSPKHPAPSTTYSDGEENTLPVLPNRVLVTESLPLPIVGPGTRTFELKKLTSTSSPTRRNYSLTLELTANPAWYAVQSLPYLMEYPYECSEQVFSRLYANLLAAQILKANPRFKTTLAEWTRQAQSGTAAQQNALGSKLAQNQELKSLLLQETPWVRNAQGETERLARLAELFDESRLRAETARALAKLQRQQAASGGFPWFEQMPDDRYITQLIVAGFGKLKKLGAFDAGQDAAAGPILQRALRYLDAATARDYAELRRRPGEKLAADHLGDLQVQALYARSFWPGEAAGASAQAAYAYYRGQAARYWPGRTRCLQAQLALALFRTQPAAPAARDILRGLRENALHSPELGMYWKEVTGGYYWREAPTETQATLIEAFDEINNDQKSVDEMKLWLLKQKQTHSWESTRATADACYALLLRGADWLAPTPPLQVTVGGQVVRPGAAQAGTGYVKTSWAAAEVRPAQGRVTLTKPDAGVAWGALYWQYFEDLDQVTPAATPLGLERQLYRETSTAGGPVLARLTAATPLQVGDVLVVRLVLRTDRALEYVHLKDQRAAGLEPIGQTSGYRYQNGLGYYESPRDAATNFFLSAVPRGTHVFEYRLRASQAGDFSGGLGAVQCLYAPEFGAHSAGGRLRVAPAASEPAK